MSELVDLETGIHPQEARAAVDRLRPYIQTLLDDDYDGDVVAGALIEAFFGCLKSTGASDWQMEKWANRVFAKVTKQQRKSGTLQDAYEPIGIQITTMIQDGYDPLAIAWSLIGAIGNIIGQISGADYDRADSIRDQLIDCINRTRAMI